MNLLKRLTGSFGAGYLLFVSAMAVALVVPQWGQLSVGMQQDSLLTIVMVPYMAGLFLLASFLFLLSTFHKLTWLSTAARLFTFVASALLAVLCLQLYGKLIRYLKLAIMV